MMNQSRRFLLLLMAVVMMAIGTQRMWANADVGEAEGQPIATDSIDRLAPDFVNVSLLVADPSSILYSCSGHCALRLECPMFELDYVYSYEGEPVSDKVLQFFMGKLKMGLFAIPTDEYLALSRDEGRGVMQYRLNLPPEAELRLWEQMDKRLEQGINLPYDYIKRGCALSTSRFIRMALDTIKIAYGPWTEYNYHTMREQSGCDHLQEAQWSRWILHCITGTNVDAVLAPEDMTIRPADLRDTWLRAQIQGHPLMEAEGQELVPSGKPLEGGWLTPMLVACVVLLLVIVSLFLRTRVIDYAVLALQTLLGLAMVYIVFFSSMPNNDWNWLVVPFTPLPLLTWHWRRYANLLWASIDLLWVVVLTFYPHHLTDNANLVLVLAITIMLFNNSIITTKKSSK